MLICSWFSFVHILHVQMKQSPSSQRDSPKEMESPRFQALLRMTGGPRKGKATDIKSFSHELDPRGVRSYEFTPPHSLHELEVGFLV